LTGEDLTPEYSPLIGPRKFCSLFMEKINWSFKFNMWSSIAQLKQWLANDCTTGIR
jgi:hypothetical protein